jgi:cytochrome P450
MSLEAHRVSGSGQLKVHVDRERCQGHARCVAAASELFQLDDEHIIGTLRLLLIAGIDTTWSMIGSCLWHLATHSDDRERLVAEPALIPTAIEEFLRAYAPATLAREIVKETEINGCHFKEVKW